MRAYLRLSLPLFLGACGGEPAVQAVAAPVVAPSPHQQASAVSFARAARCVVCHEADGEDAALLRPSPTVPLATAASWRRGQALESFLSRHHGGDDAAALAAWIRGRGEVASEPTMLAVSAIGKGQQLFRELACTACHDDAGMAGLAERADHGAVATFLRQPELRRPDLHHDFGLAADEASALAAWLLAAQRRGDDEDAAPGLLCECFELEPKGAGLPDLEGRKPAFVGPANSVDVSLRTRDDQFCLRFSGLLLVPTAGEWTFTVGSDDCSWLWIDGELLVDNAQVAPHRRRSSKRQLTAGAHAITVVYTELGGDQSLELLWRGPDSSVDEPVPAANLCRKAIELVPPAPMPAAPDLMAAGEKAYAARGCAVCHDATAAPAVAKPWASLGAGACAVAGEVGGVVAQARSIAAAPPLARASVEMATRGCLFCHVRDGQGGLSPTAREGLVEVQDLGDEGRLPPDLTKVGHRLRQQWLVRVLQGDVRARPYVRARMPRLDAATATRLGELLAAADSEPHDEDEPAFLVDAVAAGRRLVGTSGKNCATCHPFGPRAALGPQGMDLAQQFERLKPVWFAEWLLHASTLRPGTRMPTLWARDDAAARADAAAIRAWSSLGAAAPVPSGYAALDAGMELDPIERPILHGAFLEGLSARGLCVGTPQRGHYAYDLEHAQLAWLWRGPFLDARGTWEGRAGRLVRPLCEDWVKLEPLVLRDAEDAAGDAVARCIGQGRTEAGLPTFRVAVGAAVVEDKVLPVLELGGVAFVRTLRCVRGRAMVEVPRASGPARVEVEGRGPGPVALGEGEIVKIVYRW